jgi:SAM-dependent methyltransferase
MSQLRELKPARRVDWDAIYREGTPPWENGAPAAELVRLVEDRILRPARTLDIGCGTGADAIYLAKRGFEMTAVDNSPTAVERARVRAEQDDALLRFVMADAFEFGQTAGQFELVYDVGLYHFIRLTDLEKFLDLLWRVTAPGSYYFTIAGRKNCAAHGGPPPVTKREIHQELGRLFEPVELRECHLGSPCVSQGYPAWSCLMRRPALSKMPARA